MRVSLALSLGALSLHALPLGALAVGAFTLGACTLPAGEPCCADDLDCVDGARCFESRCALLCDDDSQCDEGEACLDAGVCGALARGVADDACAAAGAEDA